MVIAQIIFWVCLGIVFYTYIGYVLFLFLINAFRKKAPFDALQALPNITVIIPAYNELSVISKKIENTLQCEYPSDRMLIILITDGSDDGSESLSFTDKRIMHLHKPERLGKAAAINHAMLHVKSPIVFITDANTFIHPASFQKMVLHYQKANVGGVSGEKRIQMQSLDASVGGEGLYWKYESMLKREGAKFYSIVGAAGELFSFRSNLFRPLSNNTILDDFILSMRIVEQGYVIAYEPEAFATEAPSQSIEDEFIRKVRISSGVWQALGQLPFLFNPFINLKLFFQFVSHRLLRWTLAPAAMIGMFIANLFLLSEPLYILIFICQTLFYTWALLGLLLKNNRRFPAFLFVPFYYCMMNMAVIVGLSIFFQKKHTALWKKAQR